MSCYIGRLLNTDSAVGVGSSDLAGSVALERGVDRLGHQDRASDSQVVLAGDQRSGTEVGRSTNTLENGSETQEALGVGVGEGVGASLDGGHTSLLQGTGEELNVVLLIVGDVLKVVVVVATVTCNIISFMQLPRSRHISHTGLLEVLSGELLQDTLVENVLEVLQSKGKVEDRGINVVAGNNRGGRSDRSQKRHSAEDGVLHCGKRQDY